MTATVRVVHYLNQFFAGIGGEEQANVGLRVIDGPAGPGRLLQRMLADAGHIVSTVVAGDNYVNERPDEAIREGLRAIRELRPDVVITGPAFDAGRYGLACAALGQAVVQHLGIPVVGGMYPENPGVSTGRRALYIVPTGRTASEMARALDAMARLALTLARGGDPGPAAQAGYLPRGYRRTVIHEQPAARRAVDQLVDRLAGRAWQTEIPVISYDAVTPLPPLADLSRAKIGLVTSGGLVPRGNPDRQVSGGARACFRYSIEHVDALTVADWESVHGGFSTVILNTRNPNYALPIGTVRDLERRGVIGSLYPYFYSTVGNGTAVATAKRMADEIVEDFRAAGVDAALLVAT
ncbi:MAG: glycine/betaine/sarcosine/D-proline family reductase selenoprotein B [Chloroflexi bacterium]|nr:glycine/betaine/sarcosine/D-proline family reductase selenoprotein B [Chloroflexota bacterium]